MPLQNVSNKFIKQSDKQIIEAISSAARESNYEILNVSFNPKLGGSSFNGPFSEVNENAEFIQLIELNSELIHTFSFSFNPTFSLSIQRADNVHTDILNINFNALPDNQRIIANKFYSFIRVKLKIIDSSTVIISELNEQLKGHYEVREAELLKLENITESLIDRTEKFVQEKEKDFQTKKAELEKQFNDKAEGLKNEYNIREKRLKEEKEKLDDKLKEIDDRESKHVRRKIREDLKDELKKRSQKFGLTEGTINLRKPIYFFTIILLLIFGIGFVTYSYLSVKEVLSTSTNTSHLIALGIKQLALGLAFGSTAVFFIRWNNRWFEKHSNEEFRLKRHEIDLDRASWLVEMAFEWKAEKGTDIPIELVEKLGKNLFDEDKQEEKPLHPSDQLASAILGAASGVSVKMPGGTEVNLDRKGINKLSK